MKTKKYNRFDRRLLNVAKALREHPAPTEFRMETYHTCGTPHCALGTYIARKDLQKTFTLAFAHGLKHIKTGFNTGYDGYFVREHFDINARQASKLFSAIGCRKAKTPATAAKFIEKFVNQRVAARV